MWKIETWINKIFLHRKILNNIEITRVLSKKYDKYRIPCLLS